MRFLIWFLLLICSSYVLNAQATNEGGMLDQFEGALEELDVDENDSDQIIQFLQELQSNPINLNEADLIEFLQIPGINFKLANSIVKYRDQQPFERIEDVLKISGIGMATFQKIAPFITIGGVKDKFSNLYFNSNYWFTNPKVELITRYQQTIEKMNGFIIPDSSGGYVGSPAKYYQRIRIKSDHISFNITQEKDAGETLAGPTDFDFNSFHLGLINNGKVKKVIFGDYSLSFAQGLVIWSGGGFGKGREVIQSIGKNERGLKPYTSSQEANFFRGVAATLGVKNEFTFFYSNAPRSAQVIGIDSVRFPSISGLHRTQKEIERRQNIDQTTIGGRYRVLTLAGIFGITGYTSTFSSSIVPRSSAYQKYDFSGNTNSVVGIDYQMLFRKSLIFGEIATSDTKGIAGLIGIESDVGEHTDLAILYRNYNPKYISILGNSFSELSGTPQNERGVYIGLRHHVSKFTLSAYVDQYNFDAPKSGIQSPSNGIDVLGMIEATFSRTLSGYLLIRNESKDEVFEIVNDAGRQEQRTGTKIRSSYRIQIQHQPTPSFRSRSRVEWIRVNSSENDLEKGFLIYQDLRLNVSKKLLIDARFTLFDTDSFNTRIYQFESDLRYVLTNALLQKKGQKWYIVLKINPNDTFEFSAKITQTILEDAQFISSGSNQIVGNTKTFVGFQLRWNK